MNSENIKYRPETMSSLAAKYGVTLTTLKGWIDEAGLKVDHKRKRPLPPAKIKYIVDSLGPF